MIEYISRKFTKTISHLAWGIVLFFAITFGVPGERWLVGSQAQGVEAIAGYAIAGLFGAFIGLQIATVVLGALSVLLQINENLSAIRRTLEQMQAEPRNAPSPPPLPVVRKAG